MMTVHRILSGKEGGALTISPDATVFTALEVMAAHDIGALVVVDEGEVVGVFSERDYARKVILRGRSSKALCVRDVMSTDVIWVRPEQSVVDCMALMTQRRVRHLPVKRNGRLVGVVSIGDVVKELISEQQFTIEQLEHYITG